MYFCRVRATTSSGSGGGGLFLSQSVADSQSRTNCLSNDGWPRPGAYWSAGQKRELSGVSTSSIRSSSPPTCPNSNFVSAMRMPRCRAYSDPRAKIRRRPLAQLLGQIAAHDRPPSARTKYSRRGPSAALVAGVKIGSRQAAAFGQAGRQPDAADGAALLVFLPAGAGQIAADHALDRHDLGLAAERAAAGQQAAVGPRRQVHLLHVGGDQVVRLAEQLEPEGGNLRQHAPLVGNAGRQHPIEGADPVGAHQQQPVAQVVNVAHLAPSHGKTRQRCFSNNGHGYHG